MVKRLTLEQRKEIEGLLFNNVSPNEIASRVGICRTTVFREFKKCKGTYNAKEAHLNTSTGFKPIDFDIIGKKFGLLTIVSYVRKHNHRTWWKCKCDCGAFCVISRKALGNYCSPKRPFSCGCIAKQHKGKKGKVPFEEDCLRKYQDLCAFRSINRECWEWTGYKQKGKTPKTSWMNKGMTVRKCMYLLVHGATYEPNRVYTTCGNLFCFNPNHLTLEAPKKRQYYELLAK